MTFLYPLLTRVGIEVEAGLGFGGMSGDKGVDRARRPTWASSKSGPHNIDNEAYDQETC